LEETQRGTLGFGSSGRWLQMNSLRATIKL
jgi:hypothetical protein